MKVIKRALFGALLLGQSALSAYAVQVTSVTAQTGRVEGQSVEVSAAVDWQNPGGLPILVNPLTGPFFSVSARTGDQTIPLTFDSASGRYRGQFQGLMFNTHTATVTATKTTRSFSFPPTQSIVSASRNAAFLVGAQQGCFNFNQGNNLQGWTTVGIFNGDAPDPIAPIASALAWSDPFGFLSVATNNDGALLLNLITTPNPAAALLPSGFWRIDFRSPDLAAQTAWQGIRGVSFRMATNPAGILQVQPILQVRRPDGTTTFFRPMNGATPVFLTLISGEMVYRVLSADISVPADYTVIGARLRVFGAANSTLPDAVAVDGICPRR
jgi:hypothetical protein